jgi:type IV fimbrial biogenesis protein FimT
MLRAGRAAARGVSLVELMIALAALSILLMLAVPNMATWIQNTQIRTATEGMHAGLQLARAEALRRNRVVRFQLMDALDSGCVISPVGKNWVVSLTSAEGACDQAPSETAGPMIIQKRSGDEGSPNVVVTTNGASEVWFNGIGRAITPPTAPAVLTQIDISNPAGPCKTAAGNEPMRCLRVTVSVGGQVRICDPAVDDNTDPRFC